MGLLPSSSPQGGWGRDQVNLAIAPLPPKNPIPEKRYFSDDLGRSFTDGDRVRLGHDLGLGFALIVDRHIDIPGAEGG